MMISIFDRIENIVGKEENAGYQHFLLFLQCFQKGSPFRSLTVGIVCFLLFQLCLQKATSSRLFKKCGQRFKKPVMQSDHVIHLSENTTSQARRKEISLGLAIWASDECVKPCLGCPEACSL